MRKTALVGLLTLLLIFGVVGCDLFGTTTTTSSTTNIPTTTTTTMPFSTSETVSTTESELEVRLLSIYQLAVSSGSFTGTYEEWLDSVRGPSGREIALRVFNGFVQWQYAGESAWTDLVALASLVGPAGQNGQNGQTPSFRVSGTKLQWQIPGAATWTDLFDLSVLTGNAGKDGLEISLRVDAGFLQWQRQGDVVWTTLIDLSTLSSQPTIAISTDGFWVINGVKTDYPATAQISPQIVTVTFAPNGGILPQGILETIQVPKGDAIDLPIPQKDGNFFLGWITGNGVNDIRYTDYTPFVRNTTLYAVWQQDNAGLLAFLAAPSGMNYSGRKTLLVQTTIQGEVFTFEDIGQIKIMQKDGRTYRATWNQERDLIDGSWVVRRVEQGFEQIDTLKEGVLAEAIQYQFYDNQWHLLSEWGQVKNETGFELFDADLFVKRPGERKYDYPITNEQLRLYGVPVGDDVVLSNVECYFDLDAYQVVILLEGQAKMGTPDFHPVVATITLALFDVGATVVEVPFESAKQSIRLQVQELADARIHSPYYEAAFAPSKQAFLNLVDGYLMQIANADTFLELIAIRQAAELPIVFFAFEYDFMVYLRAMHLQEIAGHLDWQCSRATAESCQEMRAYFETNKALIQGAPDSMAMQNIVSQIYSGIQARFVIDPVVMLLEQQKMRLKEYLYAVYEVLLPYFPDFSTQLDVSMLVSSFEVQIDQAATAQAVEQAYQAFYSALLAKNIVWGDWTQAKTFLLAQVEPWGDWITRMAQNGYPVPPNAKMAFDQALVELAQMAEFVPMIRRTIEVYAAHETMLLGFVKEWAQNNLVAIRNQSQSTVPPEFANEFEQRYQQALQHIQNANGPWDIEEAVEDFSQYVQGLPVYNWQNLVNDAIAQLAGTVNLLMMQNLEVTSHQAIANLFVLARNAIQAIASGNDETLNTTTEQWHQAILWAAQPINNVNDSQILLDAKEERRSFVLEIHRVTILALAPGQATTPMDLWRDQILIYIDQAITTQELYASVGDFISMWMKANFVYQSDLEWLRSDFLQRIDQLVQNNLVYVGSYGDSLYTMIDEIRLGIESATTPVYLIMSGVSGLHILPLSILYEVKIQSVAKLDAHRQFLASQLRSDALPLLGQLYDLAVLKMDQAKLPAVVQAVLYRFMETTQLLPKDEFVMAKQFANEQLMNRYAQLWQTATEDSRIALASVMRNSQALIVSSQTHEELNAVLNEAYLIFEEVYVMDAELRQLAIYRQYYMEIGQRIIESVMFYAMNEELDHLMMMSYFQLVDQWKTDTNQTDMYLHYQEWVAYLTTLPYVFIRPLSNLLSELNSALWVEYNQIMAHGLAGDPEIVNLTQLWTSMLYASTTEVEAIANRNMAYYSVLDKAYVLIYDRAAEQLLTLYGLYQAAVSPNSLVVLDAMYQHALVRLQQNPNRFDHSSVITEFHQFASTLQ